MIRINQPYLAETNEIRLQRAFEGRLGTSNVKAFYERLVPFGRRSGFTEAECSDILGDTLLTIFKRGIQGYDRELREGVILMDDRHFSNYIFGVFRHCMIDYNKQKRRRPDITSSNILPGGQENYGFFNDSGVESAAEKQPDKQAIFKESIDNLLVGLNHLGKTEREIIILRSWNFLYFKDIAKIVNIPYYTIQRMYCASLKKLREHCKTKKTTVLELI